MKMYGVVVFGDEKYEALVPFETSWDSIDGGVFTFTAPDQKKVINHCECCNRFDLIPVVLHTIEELIEYGWIKKKEE